MREIKFRAWDSFKEEWQYQPESGDFDFIDGLEIDYDKERFILEQYTGLKDKNGKEIYEGDILAYNVYIISKGKQTFKEKQVIYDLLDFELLHTLYCLSTTRSLEVIGNIHENKDLLNGPA